jgi:hypothetical protein
VVRYYFGNVVPKGVTFDQIVPWAQFRLTWVERMVLRHRVYANAHDAARLHPDVFSSRACPSSGISESSAKAEGR